MTSQPRVPPEILQAIIDQLGYQTQMSEYDSQSWNALKACHSVSSAFRKHTLPYLFYRLLFPAEEEAESGPRMLLEAIENGDEEEYQHLAPYIKEFRFVLDIDYYSELESDYYTRLTDLFERLSTAPFTIHNIHIEFPSNMDIEWPSSEGDEFENAFIKLISSPSCRSVALLDTNNFPARLLQAGGPGIQHLELFQSPIQEGSGGRVAPRFRPADIKTDHTSDILTILRPGSSHPCLDSLQHLKINAIRSHKRTTFTDLQKIMDLAGGSLQTLSMQFDTMAFSTIPPLDLSSSDGLKSIHLDTITSVRYGLYNYGSLGTRVALGDPLFNISSTAKSLETITVKAHLMASTKAFDVETQEDLKRLSKVLTTERYPKLKTLSFDLKLNRMIEERVGEADDIFQELKPLLAMQVRDEFPELQARNVEITVLLSLDPPQPIGVPVSRMF